MIEKAAPSLMVTMQQDLYSHILDFHYEDLTIRVAGVEVDVALAHHEQAHAGQHAMKEHSHG